MLTRTLAVLNLAVVAWAQTTGVEARRHSAAERYEMFQRNLVQRGAAISRDPLQGVDSLEKWQTRRPEVRRRFLEMLGLDPMPPRTPPNVRVTATFERAGYRVENVVFESRPKLYVTGNLYLPAAGAEARRYPAIVYVSGHAPGPAGAKVQYQHHGIWFAKNGYVALVLDTLEFGEVPGLHHGLYDLSMWQWLSLGYTPAAVEVWNAIRALDYLETRPEVDRTRAGITGRSGGGAVSWFTAAADERFQAVAPVHGTWSVGPHVEHDTVKENCDCIYFLNTYQMDLPLVGALIAPRPLMIINASMDGMFPPPGYEPVEQCLRTVYGWYGVPEKLGAFAEATGHADTPAYRKAANEWMNRWLRNDATPFEEGGIAREEAARLTVLERYPAGALNEGIDRSFIALPAAKRYGTVAEWNERRSELTAKLRDQVYRAMPASKVPFATWKAESGGWTGRYADSYNVEFTTEENIRVQGQLFIPRDGRKSHPALIYVKGKEDTVSGVDYDRLLSAFAHHVVLVLKPRAVDYPMDVTRMSITKMTAGLLGATLDSMQLWDVLRSVDYLLEEEKLSLTTISVFGRQQVGGLALHAAALDARIGRVILEDAPASHWQGPALLNVLRLTDLAEVAAMVAPREIVSLTPLPATYAWTRAVFGLFGKRSAMREAASIGEALRVGEQ